MMDEQILTKLVMANGDTRRAVQLADLIDRDLEDVQTALDGLVAAGDVVAAKGFSPNGYPATHYALSPSFKRSNDYIAIMKKLTPELSAAADAMGDVEKVVNHIMAQGGTSTSAKIHALLGLAPRVEASKHLAAALQADGPLVKEGKFWYLRASKPVEEAAQPDPVAEPAAAAPVELAAEPEALAVQQEPAITATAAELSRIVAACVASTYPVEYDASVHNQKPVDSGKVADALVMKSIRSMVEEWKPEQTCVALWSDGTLEVRGENQCVIPDATLECILTYLQQIGRIQIVQ